MATIIKSIESSKKYILIGSGYGMYQSKKPNWLLGDLLADTEEGSTQVICACDEQGKIVWLNSEKVRVISIDGKSPSEYFIDKSTNQQE